MLDPLLTWRFMIGRSWSVECLLPLRMLVCDTSNIPKTHFLFRLHAGPILPWLYCQTLFGIHIKLIHALCNSIYMGVQKTWSITWLYTDGLLIIKEKIIRSIFYYLFSYFSLTALTNKKQHEYKQLQYCQFQMEWFNLSFENWFYRRKLYIMSKCILPFFCVRTCFHQA